MYLLRYFLEAKSNQKLPGVRYSLSFHRWLFLFCDYGKAHPRTPLELQTEGFSVLFSGNSQFEMSWGFGVAALTVEGKRDKSH